MPSIETEERHNNAVWWPVNSVDDYNQPLKGTPVELTVRWEWRRSEILDPQGNPIVLDAYVVLDREVSVGDLFWNGTLDSWQGTGTAGNQTELMRVVRYNETPDLKGRFTRRTADLQWFRDTPPADA